MATSSSGFIDASILTQEESLSLLSRAEDNADTKRKILQVFASLTSKLSCFANIDVKEIPRQIIPDVPCLVVEQVFCFPLDWLIFRACGLSYDVWKKNWHRYLNEHSLIEELDPCSRSQLLKEAYLATLQAEGMIPLSQPTKRVLHEIIRQYLWNSSYQFKMPSIVDIQGHVNLPLKEILNSFKIFSYSNMLQCRYEIDVFSFGKKIIIGRLSFDEISSLAALDKMEITSQKPWILVPITQREMVGAWVLSPNASTSVTTNVNLQDQDWIDFVEEIHYWLNYNALVFPDHYKNAVMCKKMLNEEVKLEKGEKHVYYWKMGVENSDNWIKAAIENSMNVRKFIFRCQFHVPDFKGLTKDEKYFIQSSNILKPVIDVNLIEPRKNIVMVIDPSPWKDVKELILKDELFNVIFPSGYVLRTRNDILVIITSVYQRYHYLLPYWQKKLASVMPRAKITITSCLLNPFRSALVSANSFRIDDG